MVAAAGAPLWEPSEERRARSNLQAYLDRHGFGGYDDAWRWSVDPATAGEFWRDVARHYGVRWHRPPEAVLEAGDGAWGARWFRGGLLNYAEHALRPPAAAGGRRWWRARRPATR